MDRFRNLAKNTAIITIGRVSTQIITFLLLPLYTAVLSTSEYGTVDLITTLVQLLIPVVSLMIDQGVFRYLLYCENDDDYKKNISSAFGILSIANLLCVALYLIISFFYINPYNIWVLLILIFTSYSNLFLQISRGLKRTTDYAIGSFVCSCSTIILNVLCIVFLNMGVYGMIFSIFLGNVMCTFFLYFKLKLYNFISLKSVNKNCMKSQLKFSLPLVPNQLSLWIMNSSDRIIVTSFLGMSANGILAVSHKFPSILMVFYNIFQLAWHETGTLHYSDDDRDDFFSEMFDIIISIFSTICIGIILVLPLLFNILINKDFHDAYYNIPIYMISFLLNVIIGMLGVIYVATKKTMEIAKTTIIAAILNIVFNVLLVNKIGLFAASISTFVGYFITLIYRLIDSKKYLRINFNHKKNILLINIILISCIIYYINNVVIGIISLLVFIPILILFNKKIFLSILELIKVRMKANEKKENN